MAPTAESGNDATVARASERKITPRQTLPDSDPWQARVLETCAVRHSRDTMDTNRRNRHETNHSIRNLRSVPHHAHMIKTEVQHFAPLRLLHTAGATFSALTTPCAEKPHLTSLLICTKHACNKKTWNNTTTHKYMRSMPRRLLKSKGWDSRLLPPGTLAKRALWNLSYHLRVIAGGDRPSLPLARARAVSVHNIISGRQYVNRLCESNFLC